MNRKHQKINIRDLSGKMAEGRLTMRIRNTITGEESTISDNNIIKVAAKEVMAINLAPPRVWDPNEQEWVDNSLSDDMSVRYMWFGTGSTSMLSSSFNYDGSLQEPILISTLTPLKRIESVYLNNSYQPSGNPYNHDDVRAILNEIVFETVMKADEYNELPDTSGSDVILAEAGLVAARELPVDDDCGCAPDILFLGTENDGTAIPITFSGSEVVTINVSSSKHTTIKAGDQIKIVASGTLKTDMHDVIEQHNPYYTVVEKLTNGRDLLLDRIPRNADNDILTGSAGIFRVGHRLICYKKIPVFRKSFPLEITFSWAFLIG